MGTTRIDDVLFRSSEYTVVPGRGGTEAGGAPKARGRRSVI